MCDAGHVFHVWVYICVYVDDLATSCILKGPHAFFDVLTGHKDNYKLKGVGPIKFHLSGKFEWDKDGKLSWGLKT